MNNKLLLIFAIMTGMLSDWGGLTLHVAVIQFDGRKEFYFW